MHLTIEGKAKPKYDRLGNPRHKFGKGIVGADIGTQTVAYTSDTEVGLKNLAERGNSIQKSERLERLYYRKHGWVPLYGDNFQPSLEQRRLVADAINPYPFRYELCAEDSFSSMLRNSQIVGCVSNKDLYIMGIPIEPMTINPQNRSGCHCLSCKTELLTRRTPCPNGCVYCFWK